MKELIKVILIGLLIAMITIAFIDKLVPQRKPYTDGEIMDIYELGYLRGAVAVQKMAKATLVIKQTGPDSVTCIVDYSGLNNIRIVDSLNASKQILRK